MDVTRMSQKKRTLLYKRAEYLLPGALKLQDLLSAAIAQMGGDEHREQINALEGTRIVLAGVSATNGMLVGKLMLYSPGQAAKFLELDKKSGNYKLDSLAMPAGATKAARREFVGSLLYLAVLENHVMFVGSHALRSSHLEQHLNWLLHTSGQLPTENYVWLGDQRSQMAMAKVKKNPVKSIAISGPIDFDVVEQVPTKRKTNTSDTIPGHRILRPAGAMADAVSAMLGPVFGNASLKTSFKQSEHIGLKLELQYRNRNRTKEGYELMDALAHAGRHFDEGECVVKLEGGGTLKGDDIRVSDQLPVVVLNDGRLEEPAIWQTIHGWLRNAISSGTVLG